MHQVPICDGDGRVVGIASVSLHQMSVRVDLAPIYGTTVTISLSHRQFEDPSSSPQASNGEITLTKEGVRLRPVGGQTYTIPLDRYNGMLLAENRPPLRVVGAVLPSDPISDRLHMGAHWSVRFTPVEAQGTGMGDKDLTILMVSAATNLTGHAYPSPNTEDGHYATNMGTMTSWTEDENRESWRFADDGRFEHLFSLPEDTPMYQKALRETYRGAEPTPREYLSVTQMVWVPTRILKFVANLMGRDFYQRGLDIEIEIHGVNGRGAGFGKGGRYLRGNTVVVTNTARYTARLAQDGVLADHRLIARAVAGALLTQLGIDLSSEGVESVQADLKDKK